MQGSKKTWESYARIRGQFLEQRAVELLTSTSPKWKAWTSLKYRVDDGGGVREDELDGLLALDSVVILLEAKSGGVSAAGRRGAASLHEDLDKVIGEAHEQVSRAKRYLTSGDRAIFTTEDGEEVELNTDALTRIIPMTVTLDDIAAFATKLTDLSDVGVLSTGLTAWTVCLHDLYAQK